MDLGITGRRAIVIGGSSGLGLAAAHALAAEGCEIVLFARNRDKLAAATVELADRHGVHTEGVAGDLTRRDDVARLAAHLRAGRGADILVLNTPRPPSPMRAFLDEDEDERWEAAYRDQLHGALNILREIAPIIVESDQGRIVGVTSASIKNVMPRHAVSTIFRAGVQAALKHLALETAGTGTVVNSVAPATIITPTFSQFHDLQRRVAETPVGRSGTTDEFGAIVTFLASRHVGYLTGQTLQLDGGRTASLT